MPGVCISHILLEVAVFVRLGAGGVEDGVVVAYAGDLHLDAAVSLLHGLLGDQDSELSGKAVAGTLHTADLSTVISVLVNDPCAGGNGRRIGKLHMQPAAVHPGFAHHLIDLLHIPLAVNGNGIGVGLVGGGGQLGAEGLGPVHAGLVDVFRGLQHPLGRRLVGAAGVDLQVIDAPVGQQVAPQRHLGGVVGFVLAVQPQLIQRHMGIAGGHNAQHLGICAFLVGQILNAGTGRDCLRDTRRVGVNTVGGNLAGRTVLRLVVVVGILLRPGGAVDGEIVQCCAV